MDFFVIFKRLVGLYLILASILLIMPVNILLAFSYDSPHQTWSNTLIRGIMIAVPISLFLLGRYCIL